MRLNKFLAANTELSRRNADQAIISGRVEVNGVLAKLGDIIIESDKITLDGRLVKPDTKKLTLALHKPVGYVVSKNGQGSKTIYDILPKKYHNLNPVGRLDKDSSGLLLLTNEGEFANKLSHPSYNKQKTYIVELNDFLSGNDLLNIKHGVDIGDKKLSFIEVKHIHKIKPIYEVIISEGRNRQIRRTFSALGLKVVKLHRTEFGEFKLNDLGPGAWQELNI